ncbi:MAG: ABC transporter ATP-binding protein [Planctomycetaceae bacterium]
MSTIPMIQFDSVTKMYGKVLGVNDITLELPPGAYGLLGPNGAGKSTLLNLLTGQLVPTRGTVRILGLQPRNNPELMKKIGFCPGFEGMYSSVSGLEWVTYLLEMQGRSRWEAKVRAMECLETVGMQEGMRRPISTYSRGMRQRTKLAQAIAHEPELMILDEPLSGLDPVGRAQMTDLLKGWIQQGRSIIIASHVLHEIEALTNSFLLISGGRVLASGTAEEVHELLFKVPMEVHVRCRDGAHLAATAMEAGLVEAVKVSPSDAGDTVQLTTRNASQLSQQISRWVAEGEMIVFEMRTADDSLQSLFNSLMRIHRGEL